MPSVRTGFLKNFFNSIVGVFIGIILILGMVCMLFFNEVKPNDADAAKSAQGLTVQNASDMDGKAVYTKGNIMGTIINDSDYLNTDSFIVIERTVEMFAYTEKSETKDNTGGSTTTTYTYPTSWVVNVPESKYFYDKNKINPEKTILDKVQKSPDLSINGFTLSSSLSFASSYKSITPTSDIVKSESPAHTLAGSYIYLNTNGGTPTAPTVGDYRISYRYVENNTEGIVLGKLSGNSIIELDYKSTGVFKISATVYRFFNLSSIEEVIDTLETENTTLLWALRILGAVLMVIGFTMLFGPLQAVAGILPFLKKVTGAMVFLVSLIAGVILSLLVILVANLLNNIITLIIIIVLLAIGIVLLLLKAKKLKESDA